MVEYAWIAPTIRLEKVDIETAFAQCKPCADRVPHLHYYVREDNGLHLDRIPCKSLKDDDVAEVMSRPDFGGFVK